MTAIILSTLSLILLAGILIRRALKTQREAEATRRLNLERQAFIQSRMDQIAELFKDRLRPSGELNIAAEALLAEIRLIDLDGNLVPLIEDTELYIKEQLADRSA